MILYTRNFDENRRIYFEKKSGISSKTNSTVNIYMVKNSKS